MIAVVIVSGFQTDAVLIPFSYDSFALTLVGWYLDAQPQEVVPRSACGSRGVTACSARSTRFRGSNAQLIAKATRR